MKIYIMKSEYARIGTMGITVKQITAGDRNPAHWFENRGKAPVVEISADIFNHGKVILQ
jgi:hypothetical protein